MTRWPEGPQFQKLSRVAAYALLAAVVTSALFAAEAIYRGHQETDTRAALSLTDTHSAKAVDPAPSGTLHASPPVQIPPEAEERVADQPVGVPIASPAEVEGVAGAVGPQAPELAAGAPAGADTASAPNAAAAPKQAQPKSSPRIEPKQVRRPAAKQATRERARVRRPVQARKPPPPKEAPNVYWERDSQLGFAPQLRRRTCDPATGHMPMQCYYPREGRERFPAKSVD